ncbi:MAG: enoyl-CoA hydratase/isomerase family protein [Alphaproteobacteria bacterium]|nr:enoyl-CoA hydratase/isomerase family protein [Alphaproteobacteria bacterium]
MSEVVTLQKSENDCVTVVINRPERMNALNLDVWKRLGDHFLALAKDNSVRAVVLRGAGTEAFAPGADIEEFDTVRASAEQARDYDEVMRRAFDAVAACPHPTIAMIYGPCVGGGLELAALCDLRLAALSSRFGVPINRISVVMGYPELIGLHRLLGPARTLEILLEGQVVDAKTALSWGLVNRVVADADLEAEVETSLKRILAGAPLANRWHKKFVRRLGDPSPITPGEMEECYAFLATEDYAEGVAAFKARRKPAFKGK